MVADMHHGVWSDAAMRVLHERYLRKDDTGKVIETPEAMCWRVAGAVAKAELNYAKGDGDPEYRQWRRTFAHMMLAGEFMPNSPTLANAGKDNGLCLSACFVLPVDDSIDGIFTTLKHAALVHKAGGGTGYSFSRLRQRGALVSKTKGHASGPVSFMKVFDAATDAISQGGMRRGANMGILRVDHPDIVEFIECKLLGGITNFNISVAVTDTFMQAVEAGTDYDLIDPSTGERVGSLAARDVWRTIVECAWRSGDPGLFFIDRANASHANPVPSQQTIEATNPCGEQPIGPYDVCNLGSINLGAFVIEQPVASNSQIDYEALENCVRAAVRFLDDVIDINPFPLPEIDAMATNLRRIGLGVMGFADMLFKMGVRYDSERGVSLGREVMQFISAIADDESAELAKERGAFPLWGDSIYRNGPRLRNSNRTTVAPTGTISIIANCSSGCEPVFALAYQHKVDKGGVRRTLNIVNPIFEKQVREHFFKDVPDEILAHVAQHGSLHGHWAATDDWLSHFVTAHDVAPEWHIRMQSAFQSGSDSGVSKTVNLPNDATVKDIDDIYWAAWNLNCIGVTVFRDGCKGTQVLNAGITESATPPDDKKREEHETMLKEHHHTPDTFVADEWGDAPEGQVYVQGVKVRPDVLFGQTKQMRAPEGKVNITINEDRDGPLEVFIAVGKAGSDVAALAEALGRLISLTLRMQSHLSQGERAAMVAAQLTHIGGSSSYGFGERRVRSLPDAVARALNEYLFDEKAEAELQEAKQYYDINTAVPLGNLCPTCSSMTLVMEEGCQKCHACGYSQC